MKKFCLTLFFVVSFFALSAVSAAAVSNDTVKVGLRYGSDALFSANLENAEGSGYAFGYYGDDRQFQALGTTGETAVSMTAAGTIYLSGGAYYAALPASGGETIGPWHFQTDASYATFDEAASAAAEAGGYPAYIGGAFVVRVGCADSQSGAESAGAGLSGAAVKSGSTGVLVTVTKTSRVLFEFDCQGEKSLGVLPSDGTGVTWFKGRKYRGGFEYNRITGGNLNVVNVLGLEDYVKGVIPYEMSGSWPLAALQAQAVCARTYVCNTTKHLASWGFDVCNTTDCQVYYGEGNSSAAPSSVSNQAVDDTAGQCLYYGGKLIDAVYFSSDGGATEDAANVWGGTAPYLIGREDPYEAGVSIPSYSYTVTYTPAELTWILQNSGYSIGTIRNVYVSEFTAMGNVGKVTFEDTSGKTLILKGDKARAAFYSSTYGKSVRSMRFTISGGQSAAYYVNGSTTLDTLKGISVISGSGAVGTLSGSGLYVITSSGTSALASGASSASADGFTVTGKGSGHNVGMSQYGAYAMAKQGLSYQDILHFYYTDVTLG
jgi:stage II sporulation protein D